MDTINAANVAITVGADEIDADNLNSGGAVNKEGRYHFECDKVEFEQGKEKDDGSKGSDAICFHLRVLAGDHEDQVDKTHYHRLYPNSTTKGNRANIFRFAVGSGLITPDDIKKAQSAGKGVDIPFAMLQGYQICAELKFEEGQEYEDKDGNKKRYQGRYQIPFCQVYDPRSDDVDQWPKDPEALASLAGYGSPGGDGAADLGGDGAAADADDEFDDI